MKRSSAAVGAAAGLVVTVFGVIGLTAGVVGAPEPRGGGGDVPSVGSQPSRRGVVQHHPELKDMLACQQCATLRLAVAAARGTDTPGASWGRPRGNPPGGGVGDDPALVGTTDVLNYDLTLEIVPSTTTLIGTGTMTVKSLADGLASMDIELHQNFAVSSVTVDGVAATFTRPLAAEPEVMRVAMPTAKANGQQFTVTVSYSGVPVSGGFGSIVFTTQAGNPLVCTLSETRFAHTWWPVKENNNDKATGDMKYIVPDTMTVAANGLLVSETAVADAKKQFRWVTGYPTAPYLFAFGATVYTRFNDTWNYTPLPPYDPTPISMPMQFFVYPQSDTADLRTGWLRTNLMLTTLSDKFGPYPFSAEKYGIYQFAFGGGMEHQTMTGQGGGAPAEQFLTAHELGHQWWGDAVTCAGWEDIWLNEGFATYSEAIWREFRPPGIGPIGLEGLMGLMAARRPSTVNGSVYCFDTSSESRIFSSAFSYNKGAWVVHMLRHVMGDEAFFQALRDHRAVNLYSTATTAQFQAVCEGIHGSSLDWFFQPWVYQIGAPKYEWASRPVTVNGRTFVEVFVEQVQTVAWPTFTMPLDVRAAIGVTPTTVKVWNDARREHLLVPTPGLMTGTVTLDPDVWVLAVSGTNNTSPDNSKVVVAFPEGPPKVTETVPAPGAHVAFGATDARVWFHRAMNTLSLTTAGRVTLSGARQGAIPVAVSLTSGGQQLVVTSSLGTLAPDDYTLTVSQLATAVTGGQQLDGEVVGGALPSGDGLPGGAAVVEFTVDGCGGADVGSSGGLAFADGVLDNNDFIAFIGLFFDSNPRADVGSQGGVAGVDGAFDNNDFIAFINLFFAGCP